MRRPFSLAQLAAEAAAAAFFLALAALATRPLALDLRGRTLAGPDPLIDMWTVHWLTGHVLEPGQLFGGNIFHPDQSAALYSDLSMGSAALVVPLRPLVSDPVPLYNVALLLALAFGGWAFHALVRDLTGDRWAGLMAGVMAAFASHQMYHVYHLNLLSIGWIALLLLALHRLMRAPSWPWVLLAGVSFALTAQSSGYYAVAAAILSLVFAAAHARVFRDRRVLAGALAAALTGALLVAPYARAFVALREREGLRRPPGSSIRMAFDPAHDLSSHAYLYRSALGSGGEQLFPGLLALGLGAVAVARRRPGSGLYAAATLVLLVLSLGPQLELGGRSVGLPYGWLFAIPPLDTMRHPYSFAAVATFTLAVLAGIGWAGLGLAARKGAGPMVVLLAVAETLGPPPALRPLVRGVPPAYARFATLPPGPVLEVPVFTPETLVWAARQGGPVVNGIGAFCPGATQVLERYVQNHWIKRTPENVDESWPAAWLAEKFPLRYLIVPAGRRPALGALAAALDRSRSFVPVATASDGDRIYEFRKENVPLTESGEGREQPGEVSGEEREPVGQQQ